MRTERSEATEDCLSAVLSETCRGLKCLIALRAISFLRKVRTSRGVIRFAHPSGRTERRALRIPALAFHKSQVLLRLAGESELLGENLCQQQIGVA